MGTLVQLLQGILIFLIQSQIIFLTNHIYHKNPDCKSEVHYVEPLQWMRDQSSKVKDKLYCIKCNVKIGNFTWNTIKCGDCGDYICPAFRIPKKDVYINTKTTLMTIYRPNNEND